MNKTNETVAFSAVHPAVLVIAGPTGIGKTALSLAIARRLPVEIVSADSRQIYRHLDIGTAKPDRNELAEVPHHMIDILDPDAEYSAGAYSKDARAVIAGIFSRGRLPVVVGGSGLYIRSLLDGFFVDDARDPAVRQQLMQRLQTDGPAALFAEFAAIDPELAATTHPNNSRRIIRALEVYQLTGRPLSIIQRESKDPAPFSADKICLTMDRQSLYERINQRVENMFAAGLVDEVKNILQMGFDPRLNALNSVGYKEVIQFLDGKMDHHTCVALVKRNSRRYAKRQLTWFRGEAEIHWVELQPAGSLDAVAEALVKKRVASLKKDG